MSTDWGNRVILNRPSVLEKFEKRQANQGIMRLLEVEPPKVIQLLIERKCWNQFIMHHPSCNTTTNRQGSIHSMFYSFYSEVLSRLKSFKVTGIWKPLDCACPPFQFVILLFFRLLPCPWSRGRHFDDTFNVENYKIDKWFEITI